MDERNKFVLVVLPRHRGTFLILQFVVHLHNVRVVGHTNGFGQKIERKIEKKNVNDYDPGIYYYYREAGKKFNDL